MGQLEIARNLGEAASLLENRHRWFVAMSRIKEAAGDLETALDSLDEAEHLYVDGLLPETRPIAAMKAHIRVKQGNLITAQAWADARGLLERLLEAVEGTSRTGGSNEILVLQAGCATRPGQLKGRVPALCQTWCR